VRKKMAEMKFEINPSKKLSFEGGFWLSYQDPLLMYFPFEIIIWDTKVF
jgi:hypothetical protein